MFGKPRVCHRLLPVHIRIGTQRVSSVVARTHFWWNPGCMSHRLLPGFIGLQIVTARAASSLCAIDCCIVHFSEPTLYESGGAAGCLSPYCMWHWLSSRQIYYTLVGQLPYPWALVGLPIFMSELKVLSLQMQDFGCSGSCSILTVSLKCSCFSQS